MSRYLKKVSVLVLFAACCWPITAYCLPPDGGSGGDRREKRRRSRWGDDENSKTFIPGMPTMLPTNLDSSQEQAYLREYPEVLTGGRRGGGGGGL